ncbi:TonB-dependent receptor plug domain-containing protein [Winogradskyella forsetii]|uniref:TonB-dependent receptor plug domain-containing protein n=1 Tax=Winogradskyella forsetii TaxID=2686077 RepID=UPI0015BB8B4E|nr:TonB-dependent receptor plug domain-containing protein [Winogradskyella forsetii]
MLKYVLVFIVIIGFTPEVFAQKKGNKVIITGTVTDSLNNPVNNAIIFVGEDIVKKATNKKGEFKLKLKSLPYSISAYSEDLGFQTSRKIENYKVVIKFDSTSLKKGKYVELLASQEIKKRNPKNEQYFANIYDYLRAKAPMLRISGTNQIRVRGYDSSFNSSSEPLFIVNGSPTSAISEIVPSNIENVSVLKDSLAAAYGVRGANGVIIITTK